MNIEQLSKHVVSINSEKEAEFVLSEFQDSVAKRAINFILSSQRKRKEIIKKRLQDCWLGTNKENGLLSEIRNKFLRNYN
jgi:uncharacterized Fe-S cluster-containing protein